MANCTSDMRLPTSASVLTSVIIASAIVLFTARLTSKTRSTTFSATRERPSAPPALSMSRVKCADSSAIDRAVLPKTAPMTRAKAPRFSATFSTPPAATIASLNPSSTASPSRRNSFLSVWMVSCARRAGSAICLSNASPVAPAEPAIAPSTSSKSLACLPVNASTPVRPRSSGKIALSFFVSPSTARARSSSTCANPTASMRDFEISTFSSRSTTWAACCGEISAAIAARSDVTASSVEKPPFVSAAVAAVSSSSSTPRLDAIGIARPREPASSGSVVLPCLTVSKRMSENSAALSAPTP